MIILSPEGDAKTHLKRASENMVYDSVLGTLDLQL